MPQMPSVKHERVAPAAQAAAAMPARASEPGSGTITKQKVLRDFQWHFNCGLRSSLPQKNRIRVR